MRRCWPRNLQVLNVELGEMRAAALTQTNTEIANRKWTNEPTSNDCNPSSPPYHRPTPPTNQMPITRQMAYVLMAFEFGQIWPSRRCHFACFASCPQMASKLPRQVKACAKLRWTMPATESCRLAASANQRQKLNGQTRIPQTSSRNRTITNNSQRWATQTIKRSIGARNSLLGFTYFIYLFLFFLALGFLMERDLVLATG